MSEKKTIDDLIVAIAAIGITPQWAGGCASRPDLFKGAIKAHRSAFALMYHPDTGSKELSNRSGEINAAFDLIVNADDRDLAEAMRATGARAMDGRFEELSQIGDLTRQVAEFRESLTDAESRALSAETRLSQASTETDWVNLREYVRLRADLLRDKPEKIPCIKDGDRITVASLVGKLFATPIEVQEQEAAKSGEKELSVSTCVCSIRPDGTLMCDPENFYRIYPFRLSPEMARKRLKRFCHRRLDAHPFDIDALTKPLGTGIGFVLAKDVDEKAGSTSVFESPFETLRPGFLLKTKPAAFLESCRELLTTTATYVASQPVVATAIKFEPKQIGLVVLSPDVAEDGMAQYTVIPIGEFLPSRRARRKK